MVTLQEEHIHRNNNTISYNEWVIGSGNETSFPSNDMFSVIEHELRHAYQYNVCNHPDKFVVTDETMKKWQENYDNYKLPDDFKTEGMSDEDAFKAYQDQALEADARSFVKQ